MKHPFKRKLSKGTSITGALLVGTVSLLVACGGGGGGGGGGGASDGSAAVALGELALSPVLVV